MTKIESVCVGREFYCLFHEATKVFEVLTREGRCEVACEFFTSSRARTVRVVRMTISRPKQLLINVGTPDVVWAEGHSGLIAPYGREIPAGWNVMLEEASTPYQEYACPYLWPASERVQTFREVLSLAV